MKNLGGKRVLMRMGEQLEKWNQGDNEMHRTDMGDHSWDTIQKASSEQENIVWDQVMCSRISKNWGETAEEINTEEGSKRRNGSAQWTKNREGLVGGWNSIMAMQKCVSI